MKKQEKNGEKIKIFAPRRCYFPRDTNFRDRSMSICVSGRDEVKRKSKVAFTDKDAFSRARAWARELADFSRREMKVFFVFLLYDESTPTRLQS